MNQFEDIFVNRIGLSDQAYMKTIKLINVFENKYQNLYFDGKNISATECASNRIKFNTYSGSLRTTRLVTKLKDAPDIARIQIAGKFINLQDQETHDNNILGTSDLFIYNNDFEIPEVITNQATLNFYGAHLIRSGEIFNLENNKPMPLFEITVGPNYVSTYLLQENLGNGFYIESHDTPHYHQPLNENSSGYMILGKRFEDQLIMSKFKIPYGCGLYTPPYVYHSDAYLVGDYNVIYNKADNYKTFMFRNEYNKILKIN